MYRKGLSEALHAGNDILMAGGNALDAVVAAVVALEGELSDRRLSPSSPHYIAAVYKAFTAG